MISKHPLTQLRKSSTYNHEASLFVDPVFEARLLRKLGDGKTSSRLGFKSHDYGKGKDTAMDLKLETAKDWEPWTPSRAVRKPLRKSSKDSERTEDTERSRVTVQSSGNPFGFLCQPFSDAPLTRHSSGSSAHSDESDSQNGQECARGAWVSSISSSGSQEEAHQDSNPPKNGGYIWTVFRKSFMAALLSLLVLVQTWMKRCC